MITNLSRCHFRATYLALKAMQVVGAKLGLYVDLGGRSKAKRVKTKAEVLY